MCSSLLDPNLVIALAALVISLIALLYTVLTYLLKSGHKIRCNYTRAQSWDANDAYITDLTVENLKDRATVIFDIYMQFGSNVYLEIETFEDSPLILQPFAVYHKHYDPVLLYADGTDRKTINTLITSDKVRKRIVLNTTDGKVTARLNRKRWSPISLFFRNYFTIILRPSRLSYKDKSYGPLVRYLVVLQYKEGHHEVIPLRLNDNEHRKFTRFTLTKESLQSVDALRSFLEEKHNEGLLNYETLEVLDYGKQVDDTINRFNKSREAVAVGYWQYSLVGWWFTKKQNRKLDRENKKSAQKRDKALKG